ncbi:hypothetical protein SYNPS1DRAFT_25347 [Syncephalis pseudoplumigaleata]|nr:hypothetical protein SYNPS1DRAFT_25347 [Syncephalis pseudoplumigaleata]|eukprot:RKP22778.1 hypothetical protein SYNPS1DRAFT_25347 [Syncephalis pseudoplumigaleata]
MAPSADHLRDVSTVCLEWTTAGQATAHLAERLERWMQTLLWEKCLPGADQAAHDRPTTALDILRLKGAFHRVTDPADQLHVIQGVQELYEVRAVTTEPSMVAAAVAADQAALSTLNVGKLVLIGRGLDREQLARSLCTSVEVNIK